NALERDFSYTFERVEGVGAAFAIEDAAEGNVQCDVSVYGLATVAYIGFVLSAVLEVLAWVLACAAAEYGCARITIETDAVRPVYVERNTVASHTVNTVVDADGTADFNCVLFQSCNAALKVCDDLGVLDLVAADVSYELTKVIDVVLCECEAIGKAAVKAAFEGGDAA